MKKITLFIFAFMVMAAFGQAPGYGGGSGNISTSDLATKLSLTNVVQTTGTSTTAIMSQAAVTAELAGKADNTDWINGMLFIGNTTPETATLLAYTGNPLFANITGLFAYWHVREPVGTKTNIQVRFRFLVSGAVTNTADTIANFRIFTPGYDSVTGIATNQGMQAAVGSTVPALSTNYVGTYTNSWSVDTNKFLRAGVINRTASSLPNNVVGIRLDYRWY